MNEKAPMTLSHSAEAHSCGCSGASTMVVASFERASSVESLPVAMQPAPLPSKDLTLDRVVEGIRDLEVLKVLQGVGIATRIEVRANAPRVPKVLSDNPCDPNYVFERNTWEPLALIRTAAEVAEENDLIEALEGRLASELQDLLDERRREVRKQRAIQSGRDWDPRPDLGVFQIKNQVWRWKDSRPPLGPEDRVEDDPSYHGVGVPACLGPSDFDDGGLSPAPTSLEDLKIAVSPSGYIINEDDRELISSVTGYDMTSWPWRCIGVALDYKDTFFSDHCSAFKLYDRVVVTNGHCLPWAYNWVPGRDGIAGENPVLAFPNGERAAVASTAHQKWVDHQWNGWDIGVLILPDTCWSRALGNLGVSSNLGLYHKPAYSYGYPAGACKAAQEYDGNSACRRSMYGMKGEITGVYQDQLSTNIDVLNGQSGSPLWRYVNDGEIKVVGVVRGGAPSKLANRAVRIEKDKHSWLQTFRDQHKSSFNFCPPNDDKDDNP